MTRSPSLLQHALLASAALAVFGLATPTAAQTVDYSSLEFLFDEPATTSAIGQPQRLSDVPVNMTIITRDQIRRSGTDNIADIIDRVGGVNVRRNSLQSRDVAIRGYNQNFSQRLLVLVNGRQVYLDTYGYTAWSAIPVQLEEIRQIEVVKGPNAALFGFNATGGVVNIVTFNPLYDDVDEVTLRVGTQETVSASGAVSFKLGEKVGVRVSAAGLRADEFEFDTVSPLARDPSRTALNSELLAQVTDNVQLGAEFSFSETNSRSRSPFGSPLNEQYDTFSGRLSLHADTEFGLITARAYHNRSETQFFDAGGAAIDPLENETTVVQLENVFKLNTSNTFRIGAEYRHNTMNTVQMVTSNEADLAYDVFSISGMWNRAVTDEISVVAAARFDHLELAGSGDMNQLIGFDVDDFDQTIDNLSFNLAGVYKPTEKDTLRVSVARAAVLPSLMELGAFQIGAPAFSVPQNSGNPDLDPLQVTNFEIGYERSLEAISGRARAAVFYQINEGYKSSVTDLATLNTQSQEVGDSNLFGFEVEANGHFDEIFHWGASYTALFVDDSNDLVQREETTPEHEVEIQFGATVDKWEVDLFGRYVSSFERNDGAASFAGVDGYAQLDARVGYRITDTVVAEVAAQQILERNSDVSGSNDDERRLLIGINASF